MLISLDSTYILLSFQGLHVIEQTKLTDVIHELLGLRLQQQKFLAKGKRISIFRQRNQHAGLSLTLMDW
jgi:hypothetical protein